MHLESAAITTSKPFRDRDLAWLEFNRRVLHEAADERNPLLERVKFLAIAGNNLDEFFMKRIGALKQKASLNEALDGDASYKNLLELRSAITALLTSQAALYSQTIVPELARHGIRIVGGNELSEGQAEAARQFFQKKVFPILTPLAVDPGHPFPILSNLSTSLGIMLRNPETDGRYFARVKVPGNLPQLVPLPSDLVTDDASSSQSFIRLLDLIHLHLDALFPGMIVTEVMPFRITRTAAVDIDDDEAGESLAAMVEEEIRQRRFERVIRLEYAAGGSGAMLSLLLGKLELGEIDAYEMTGELDYTDLFTIAGLHRTELHESPWHPIVPATFDGHDPDMFAVIRAGDVLVHHPYESFEASVERFIRRAASDPKVVAIKMTIYRVGAETPFLDALLAAAEAGKEVACLVEVTASFDERQNLTLANTLEKAGIHVVYGMVGLKTHCKTTLVVRQDEDGLRCYAHIGTGNYHVKTARLYTDLGLFTCDPIITGDVVDLFHYLTGLSLKRNYVKLLVAPVNMRDRFLAMIREEVRHHQAGRPAHLIAKMNQLEDREICDALIEASQAGLQIDLIIRGLCVLNPGIPGVTENIRVISIIGRFLEHSRIYYFRNGAEEPRDGNFLIGSADWMHRNLSGRVEAIVPIEAPALRRRLGDLLEIMLDDRRQAWDMQSDGTYIQRRPINENDATAIGTHQLLMNATHAS
ncbi:MAG: polyphosphate kinase 1 [Planctomycetia bacterium]|nr:polyphosphate kinase 1 [Planctomycetia bacterium]